MFLLFIFQDIQRAVNQRPGLRSFSFSFGLAAKSIYFASVQLGFFLITAWDFWEAGIRESRF